MSSVDLWMMAEREVLVDPLVRVDVLFARRAHRRKFDWAMVSSSVPA
jgi:hypothetical protein